MSAALQSAQTFQWLVASDAQSERAVCLLGSSSPYDWPQTSHFLFAVQVAVPPVWASLSLMPLQSEAVQACQWSVASDVHVSPKVWVWGGGGGNGNSHIPIPFDTLNSAFGEWVGAITDFDLCIIDIKISPPIGLTH